MGTVDLPAMIDYITIVTGHQRMHYVGHSQGTTSFFVMCAMRPEYNNRIISGHMLAPIAFMGRLFSPFVRAAALFQNSIDVSDAIFFFAPCHLTYRFNFSSAQVFLVSMNSFRTAKQWLAWVNPLAEMKHSSNRCAATFCS